VSDALLAGVFGACAVVSLTSSWVLVSSLERLGARLGLSEALLGMLAALAADAPEITAAITALAGHQSRLGAGVVIGSNVFNLAALLGIAALLAGTIRLHRRVILLEGIMALWIAAVSLLVIVGELAPPVGLGLVLAVLIPYLAALGVAHDRLRRLGLPASWSNWLTDAISEEELELEPAIHPRCGRTRDAVAAASATLVVVAASAVMERTASTLGTRYSIPQIVVGGLILAGVTSLPNAVAAAYLATRSRGAATLSTAMNSNAINITAGLLLATAYASRAGVLLSIAAPAAIATAAAAAARLLHIRRQTPTPHPAHKRHAVPNQSLVAGWSINRIWCLVLSASALIAAADAILGHCVILIGLLIAGPCCALLTARWPQTATAGAWATALATILGLRDGIWGSFIHLAFLGSVAIVAIVTTSSAALLQRRR